MNINNIVNVMGYWQLLLRAASIMVLGFVLLWPNAALASGGSIDVVGQETIVHLPGGVTFEVKVQSDADIVEVRLSYRNANGGPWSYTYLNLEPGLLVETSFTLDTTQGTYIPPGAGVEYFYTIRDAQGGSKTTDRRTLLYTDSRFRWQSTVVGPLTLLWHDQPEERVQTLTDQLQESLARVEDLLEVELDGDMRGVIYNNRNEAAVAFPNLSATIDEEQVFHGFAFTEWNVFTGVGLRLDLITHEASHLYLGQATAQARVPIPAWLSEGFASYVEPGSRPALARSLESRQPRPMPLRTMGSVPGRLSEIGFFYRKSESVVGYLIESHGQEKFRRFIGALNGGLTVDGALLTAYGFNQAGLEQEWLGNDHDPAPAPNNGGGRVFLQLESALLGGLVLLVAAVVMGRILFRRLVPQTQVQDPWDEGENYPL